MRLFWTIAKGLGVLLAIAAIGVGVWVALNWTFVRNMATGANVGVTDVDWYRPLERVEGASDAPPLPRAETASISPEALAAAQAYSDEMDGIGLIVFHDGAIQHETYSEDFGPGRRSVTFSMHKSVLGLVYMAALADGYVGSLDDPIGDYIEAWADDPRGEIALRDFLTMSSGIRLYSLASGDIQAMQLVLSDRVTKTALKSPIEKPAGSAFSYNNASSQIAGAALEAALARNGLTYADYLSDRLWRPIGASDAYLWLARSGGEPRYFSGLQASLSDWLRVGLLIADGGMAGGAAVIPPELMAVYTAPSAANPQYGVQIWLGNPWTAEREYSPTTRLKVIHSEPYRVDDIVFFDGFGGQRVYVSPSLGLVVARAGSPRFDYDDAKIVNLLIDGIVETTAAD